MVVVELTEELKQRINDYDIEISKRNFWHYCKTLHPDFYLDDRIHLKILCDTLQAFYEGKLTNPSTGKVYKKLIIRMPPRHGKTRTLILWEMWIFGKDLKTKIITCSYNDDSAQDFSQYVRDGISETKNEKGQVVYSDIFPGTKVKRGTASKKKWALVGCHFSYKGAGIAGSVTGKGGNGIIIDDPVKNAEEAYNENRMDKIWQWYTGTLLSRREKGAWEVICHTPWCAGDIGSRVLKEPGKDDWYVISMPAYTNGKMLCPGILDYEGYVERKRDMDELIFSANYDLEIIQAKNLLYKPFRTYTELPKDENGSFVYNEKAMIGDTADKGSDYLCMIYGYVIREYFYVIDVYFTQDDISVTEEEAAERCITYKMDTAYIESNSAGHSWGYHVEEILGRVYTWYGTSFLLFTQSKNKESRIFSKSSSVNKRIIFPAGWKNTHPEFYHHVMTYQRVGKNKHDDGPDALTMIIEYIDEGAYIDTGINHDVIPRER